MAGKLDVCNLALAALGANTLTSVDERTNENRACQLHYDVCLDEVLRAFAWPFATRVEPLAEVPGVTVPGWGFVYGTPEHCVRILAVETEAGAAPEGSVYPFELLSADGTSLHLCCNVERAFARFTARVEDPTLWNSQFMTAFAYRLAAAASVALSEQPNRRGDLMNLYRLHVSEAQAAAANEAAHLDGYRRYTSARV